MGDAPLARSPGYGFNAIVCGACFRRFHPLWQVSDHPASVHGIQIDRVPTINFVNIAIQLCFSYCCCLCARVVTRVKACASLCAHSEHYQGLCLTHLYTTYATKTECACFYRSLLCLSHGKGRPTTIDSRQSSASVHRAQSHQSLTCCVHPLADPLKETSQFRSHP